jgi:hypothetical protein
MFNGGCFKCQKCFVDHRLADCTNDYPPIATYKTLVQANVNQAKRAHAQALKTVAAITSENKFNVAEELVVHPVATIMGSSCQPFTYAAMNSSNVIEPDSNSDEEEVRCVPTPFSVCTIPFAERPIRSCHLMWDCVVSGPAGCFPLSFASMLDSASPYVMISEDTALNLQL